MDKDKLSKELLALAEGWEKERAHTYASENADHYRGFDDGRMRSAQQLRAIILRHLPEARGAETISITISGHEDVAEILGVLRRAGYTVADRANYGGNKIA